MSLKPRPADYGRNARRTGGILADPELSDLLVRFAVVLGRALDRVDSWPDKATDSEWRTFSGRAGIALGDRVGNVRRPDLASLRHAIRGDRRRYDLAIDNPKSWWVDCGAPMIRRAGTCGQRASESAYLRDPQTGRVTAEGGCSRHREWWRLRRQAHAAQLGDRIVPKPFANTGGRLPVHVPEIDWGPIYRWTDNTWEWPPEREAPTERPTLKLVPGDAPEPLPVAVGDGSSGKPKRPFSVIDGGER